MAEVNLDGLKLLRVDFPEHQVSKLPKPTKAQTDAVKADFKAGVRCPVCGGWHHPKVVHLDYVGHAALTDRLLDADPAWTWEPMSLNGEGLPRLDASGGMWIRLTVCGVTRLGYGHAGEKTGGDAIKEVIGDALRNSAMRFGAALDLWHKGDLHIDDPDDKKPPIPSEGGEIKKDFPGQQIISEETKNKVHDATLLAMEANDADALRKVWGEYGADEQVELWKMFNSAQRTAIKKLLGKEKTNA